MKKLILMGKSGAGKTTLIERLRGEKTVYRKTQCIDYAPDFTDTPGEYTQGRELGGALAVYSYEADVVGLLVSATDEYCIFPPACTAAANRPCIGIVTKCDLPKARTELCAEWLRQCGCERIFYVAKNDRSGIDEIIAYLAGNTAL